MSHNKNKHPFLKMTALALGCMAVYNTYEYNKATSGNHNHREECRVYTGRFGDIYYKHYGSGSPVLLLHTLEPSANMSEWIAAATELGKSHSVYRAAVFRTRAPLIIPSICTPLQSTIL